PSTTKNKTNYEFTNNELRRNDEARMPKGALNIVSSFGHSFGLRHSSFVIFVTYAPRIFPHLHPDRHRDCRGVRFPRSDEHRFAHRSFSRHGAADESAGPGAARFLRRWARLAPARRGHSAD